MLNESFRPFTLRPAARWIGSWHDLSERRKAHPEPKALEPRLVCIRFVDGDETGSDCEDVETRRRDQPIRAEPRQRLTTESSSLIRGDEPAICAREAGGLAVAHHPTKRRERLERADVGDRLRPDEAGP